MVQAMLSLKIQMKHIKKLKKFLNENDLGFPKDRELDKVELIADSYHYTDVGCLLHL